MNACGLASTLANHVERTVASKVFLNNHFERTGSVQKPQGFAQR
jgi:hypothetical protein